MTFPSEPQPSIYVRRIGEGARNVLALHCTIAHSGAWSGLARALAPDVCITAPDMLSHGLSPDWDGQGDYFDAVSRLSAAELTWPMDMVGHSFGAMIALKLAIEQPDRIRSLVLIEPVFFAIAKRDARHLFDQHEKGAEPIAEAFANGDKTLAARLFNRMWSTQNSTKWSDLPERTRASMVRGIDAVPAVHAALYDDAFGLLAPEALKRASMPTLLLSGSESHPVMPAICDGLKQRLPDAAHTKVYSAGHMLPISHPAETAALLDEFWESRSPLKAD